MLIRQSAQARETANLRHIVSQQLLAKYAERAESAFPPFVQQQCPDLQKAAAEVRGLLESAQDANKAAEAAAQRLKADSLRRLQKIGQQTGELEAAQARLAAFPVALERISTQISSLESPEGPVEAARQALREMCAEIFRLQEKAAESDKSAIIQQQQAQQLQRNLKILKKTLKLRQKELEQSRKRADEASALLLKYKDATASLSAAWEFPG